MGDAALERTIGLGDVYGTRAEVSVTPADEDGDAMIHASLMAGQSGGRANPTPEAARQWAAALLDAADAAERSEAEGR